MGNKINKDELVVWAARTTVYDKDGYKMGTVIDTPNAIAVYFLDNPKAATTKGQFGTETRASLASRIKMLANNSDWANSLRNQDSNPNMVTC
jgi:N-acetylmuramoyl-L-alanine amidase CwlA